MAREELFSNLDDFVKALKAKPPFVEKLFGNKVRDVIYTLHAAITERTPVNTGQTLANYQWTMGTPYNGLLEAEGSGVVEPTNMLPLGVESRRPANQAQSDESLYQLSFVHPYQNYYLTNNDPTFGPLEAGEWPEPPYRQRSPEGMVAVSMIMINELLESGVL